VRVRGRERYANGVGASTGNPGALRVEHSTRVQSSATRRGHGCAGRSGMGG